MNKEILWGFFRSSKKRLELLTLYQVSDKAMSDTKNIPFNKLLPYLGSFMIFLGMVRLLLYYGSFGVRITNYLDLSEIITSFFGILAFASILMMILIIQYLKSQNKKKPTASRLNG